MTFLKNPEKRLTESIAAYNLYVAMEGLVAQEDPRAWLLSRVADMGVEASEDWMLLSPDDFAFTGIDENTIAEMKANYPRELAMNGAKFRVEYQPEKQIVTLQWIGGLRQPILSSWMLPRWNDWTVQVDIRGTLRTLRA